MSYLSDDLRQIVINRAQNRCEYCGLSQQGQAATFHIDHIFPISAGGQSTDENLALACVGCSLHKAARLTAPDPETGNNMPLFHPRQDEWPHPLQLGRCSNRRVNTNRTSHGNCFKNESANHDLYSSRGSPIRPSSSYFLIVWFPKWIGARV